MNVNLTTQACNRPEFAWLKKHTPAELHEFYTGGWRGPRG